MKQSDDIRKLMERTIEAMEASVDERRDDGKITPKVGALLLFPGGSVDLASRGELRDGDHAEFALLERKHRSSQLDGTTLFTTLEPCAPGARKKPKLSCAERIVLARIAKVYVGIEDPDPTVDRRGIKYLQDHGIEVEMFDADLQEVIRAANKDFIDQALERRADMEAEQAEPVVLSNLERPIVASDLGDFSEQALREFHAKTSPGMPYDSAEFRRRLKLARILEESGSGLAPTGFGVILFGKEPRLQFPQAGLLATYHHADGSADVKDFDGPAVEIPDQAMEWLNARLRTGTALTQARRSESTIHQIAREGIVNALVHRDYDIAGAKSQLHLRDGGRVIEIWSPGAPVAPLTVAQLQSLDAPMLSRNPSLHYVFNRLKLAEERGLGLKSMRQAAKSSELPLPSFSYDEPYLKLAIYADAEAALTSRGPGVLEELSPAEQEGWKWISAQEGFSTADYESALGVPNRTARNHITTFLKLGLLRRHGRGRATRYEVIRS